MKIFVKAKPGAKVSSIRDIGGLFEKGNAPHFLVSVKEPAQDGKANRAIITMIARHFHVALGRVHIISGHTSSMKVIEIEE